VSTRNSAKGSWQAGHSPASIADMSQLTPYGMHHFFTYLADVDRNALDLAMVLLSTGLKPSRPWSVRPVPSLLYEREEVRLSHDGLLLRYGILKGATDFAGQPDGSLSSRATMQLVLPDPIGERLAQLMLSKGGFRRWVNRLDRRAQVYHRDHPSVTPTAHAIAASNISLFGKENGILKDIDRATIAGKFHADLGAEGYYPAQDLATLNQAYRDAFDALVIELRQRASPALVAYLDQIHFRQTCPSGVIGSQVDINVEDYVALLTVIRDRVTTGLHEVRARLPGDRLPLIVDLLNLQQAYCYVLQQLGFGTRPIGPASVIAIAGSDDGACIREKNSARFVERSYSPLPPTLLTQMAIARETVQTFMTQQHRLHFAIKEEETKSTALNLLAQYFTWNDAHRTVTVQRMQQSDFETVLQCHGFEDQSEATRRRNASRHFHSSTLHATLASPLVMEFLSHKTLGHDYLGAWSMGTRHGLRSLDHTIETLLHHLSPEPLTLKGLFQ